MVASALPVHANERFVVVVVALQFALMRVMQRVAQAARQVDVGGGDHDVIGVFLDRHDPLERVFGLDARLVVAHQIEELRAVRLHERSFQPHVTGGLLFLDALARRAARFGGLGMPCAPLPSSALEHRAAVRTRRMPRRFALVLVGIVIGCRHHLHLPVTGMSATRLHGLTPSFCTRRILGTAGPIAV